MRNLCKIIFLIGIFISFFSSIVPRPSSLVYAVVPHLINYQGRLSDKSGKPLEGSYSLTFRIYDAETAGNLLWEETYSGVVIQKGVFSVLLGSVTNLDISFDKLYFLEIKVGSEVMSPRQRIASAGYAINAEKAEAANTITSILATNKGGTGTDVATYCNLATNVIGILPAINGGTNFKVGSFTRDVSSPSGSVSYAGVGFQPRVLLVLGGDYNLYATRTAVSIGISDNSINGCISVFGNVGYGTFPTVINWTCNGSTGQTAVVKSFNADGFTLIWTELGSPSPETKTWYYLAIK